MAEPEPEFVVCVRWGAQHVPSVRRACSSCGAAVAMSKRTLPRMPTTVRPLCMDCTPPEAFENPTPAPGAMEEALVEWLRRGRR